MDANAPLEKDEKIGPVNLFMHSLFSQMDISLNDRLVSNSSNTYPYRSYFETMLNHGFDCKTSQLTSEMFYNDNNDGLKLSSKFFELSATVDMIGGSHGDLFHQERLLLNLVDVKVKLIRSKPEFCLQGNAGYKVVLEKINLLVRKKRVSPGVSLGHAKALENGTAKYPLNCVLCKVYSVPQGSMSFVQDNIFVGQMPERIIVGCVDNDAFHDESLEPGSHWIAFYCENGCIQFFDSFGNPPVSYDPRFHEITLRYPSACWNSTPLQNLTSNVCGIDRSQIMHLGRQLYPSQTKFFREVYEDATSKPFSYLLIDLIPDTDDSLRLRSGIFPGDKYCVYQPRSSFPSLQVIRAAVLDFEGFQISAGSFIIKELAVCAVHDDTFCGRWLFKPPHPFELLEP
ncbi:hypothetical protein CDAR_607591 [Caerostris darwini]|uniref:Uncharacterized protein n=2 Tax=Caerostris darwini TaxID=1538125 RepID=A0AAV4REW2_9ARAC|nr:hypothetical protein CDAR_607591 [Caerostris darwini]